MIRIVIAILCIVYALISLGLGGHPVQSIMASVIAMGLIAWFCVDKFDNQPAY